MKNLLSDVEDPGSIPGSEDLLEKEMATHSSIFAWEKPHGQRSQVDYRLWGRKESDMA